MSPYTSCPTSSLSILFSQLQFIREYTGKVDELIKHKLEAQREVKEKEAEEKEKVAQQVWVC